MAHLVFVGTVDQEFVNQPFVEVMVAKSTVVAIKELYQTHHSSIITPFVR
jgi:hypothetical protein